MRLRRYKYTVYHILVCGPTSSISLGDDMLELEGKLQTIWYKTFSLQMVNLRPRKE